MSQNESKSIDAMYQDSYLANTSYLEDLYDLYLKNPQQLTEHWRNYFSSLPDKSGIEDTPKQDVIEEFQVMARQPSSGMITKISESDKQAAVDALIRGYRRFGHYRAAFDPLEQPRHAEPRLDPSFYRLAAADMDKSFATDGVLPTPQASLREIVNALQSIYCGAIGFQYNYISQYEERLWLQHRIESLQRRIKYTKEQRLEILEQLVSVDVLEKFFDRKFPGQTRFSIEGTDALIPLMKYLITHANSMGIHELVLGMAHRGRLNVLINIMGKPVKDVLAEFAGHYGGETTGDVKYHLGISTDVPGPHGAIHLSLECNPSHLEAVTPVVLGSVRARQERHKQQNRDYTVPVIMHGDAAFAGQGVVMESLNMSQTPAYTVGGAIHIILNNQIGFTTADGLGEIGVLESRSSTYCTDIAKMIEAPVIHVNADCPEEVLAATHLALDYRIRFHKDVIIDLVGYRRKGHNEADDARATQPHWYRKIANHPSCLDMYKEKCVKLGIVTEIEVKTMSENYRARLNKGEIMVDIIRSGIEVMKSGKWAKHIGQSADETIDSSVDLQKIQHYAKAIEDAIPYDFTMLKQVKMIYNNRVKMAAGELPLDWGFAETMAYASIVAEGHPIRLTGQDVPRGTFFHRHAAIFDSETAKRIVPLQHISKDQAMFHVYNSNLCEEAAVGYEYGFSTADPRALVIWEAQFGDFYNGSQMYVDQFISSGWQKWQRLSGLVMLLPHGYEGKGPEHSSGRLERFLQLCAQENMQVCVPTTPAQMFHMLRRQILRNYKAPLIAFTPKSLLRHKMAVSSLQDLTQGEFKFLIDDMNIKPSQVENIEKVILCCGKVYYDLVARQEQLNICNVAIVRIEQLYPFPEHQLTTCLARYTQAHVVIWCQEEPKNQGSWYISRHHFLESLASHQELFYEGRPAMAAPAEGSLLAFKEQQAALLQRALTKGYSGEKE